MHQGKPYFLICIGLLLYSGALSQRLLTEARLEYQVSAKNIAANDPLPLALEGCKQIVWLRGNMARVDFLSSLRNQSTIYNASTGETTILREAVEDKYLWKLDSVQWRTLNSRWKQATLEPLEGSTEIGGYSCLKANLRFADSSNITIFYSVQMIPLYKGFDPLFEKLDGLPVQYEMRFDQTIFTYTLISIQTSPISTSYFDTPESGYKIMKAPYQEPL